VNATCATAWRQRRNQCWITIGSPPCGLVCAAVS